MIEYKLMNRDELTDYIFNWWCEWGAFELDEREDEEIKAEIWENLSSKNGIEKELDYIRDEFEKYKDENSVEYEELDKIWNYLNWYKTDFWKESENNE